jgi:hypothetical protein
MKSLGFFRQEKAVVWKCGMMKWGEVIIALMTLELPLNHAAPSMHAVF